MYKFYLGSFGNRSFLRPQFEILNDGSLRIVGDDRWTEFPNGGTVSLSFASESDTDEIKNRLVKFKIDFNKDLHPGYSAYSENSNKYQISLTNIEEHDREDIIEILDLECTINEFLNDKSKRSLRIKHKPNKLILLKSGQDCYGPFEFMVSDVEDSYGEDTYYVLKVFVNSGTVNRYKYSDLERIIYDASFSIRRSDRMQFIFNMEKLISVAPIDEMEYYDNEELADYLKNILNKSSEIENVSEIREEFLQIVDQFSESNELSDKRIERICELLQTAVDLSDYKVKITEEYFKHNPNAKTDKEAYLSSHEELLDGIVREDIHYNEKVQQLSGEIVLLKERKVALESEIEDGKRKLSDQQTELKKLGELALTEKQQEIESLISSKQFELSSIQDAIEKAKTEYTKLDGARDVFRREVKQLKEERDSISNDINSKITQWASDNRNSEIISLLVSQLEMPEVVSEKSELKKLDNLAVEMSASNIVEIIQKKLADAGRVVTKDDVYNYIISITQNYITVFAGVPGTGKTSLCKLIAKALGVFDTRFAEILVERGWTSSKDLIGYYNPLTKEIERTQPKFSECMELLDLENRSSIVEAPYFVLLDEANLSPIEFYWSHFNYYCDDPKHQVVSYSNGDRYEFGPELKFLATINYDQTTTDLSPRFLDRAWVISMNSISIDSVLGNMTDDTMVVDNEEIVSLENLNKLFDWKGLKDKKMNQVTKTRLDLIVAKMKEGLHTVSARSLNAISHYYLVAEEFMSSKEVALDYAIAQKILPSISGNGKAYGEFLNSLMSICKENQLSRSAGIIAKILEKSEHEFYGFFNI